MTGRVWVVGGGPGDPELITVKGLKLVRRADVIVYDRLAPRGVLAEAKQGAELVYAGKEPGRHSMTQEEINELLYERASRGMEVVRLKGGDPLTFGRGEEECMYLAGRGVECRIIPGVTSYNAAAASMGVPLAGRGYSSSFAVLTGMEDPGKARRRVDLRRIAGSVDSLVILMGASRAAEILGEVMEVRGADEHVGVVINASLPEERIIAGRISEVLEKARAGEIVNPAVIIIGPQIKPYINKSIY